jgi:hypothetical protein
VDQLRAAGHVSGAEVKIVGLHDMVGTHAGHVADHELAARQSPAQPLPGLEQRDGKLTDNEFTAVKAKLLD